MRVKNNKKLVSWLLCTMLIVAMALTTVGCGTDEQNGGNPANTEQSSGEVTVLGEGKTVFDFTVVDKDGNETAFEIHTDKEMVGEALMELNLIAGDEGAYGLYVKSVNGITADYDVDQTYWAFYINDSYAVSGVDVTAIEAGAKYAFKVEK